MTASDFWPFPPANHLPHRLRPSAVLTRIVSGSATFTGAGSFLSSFPCPRAVVGPERNAVATARATAVKARNEDCRMNNPPRADLPREISAIISRTLLHHKTL